MCLVSITISVKCIVLPRSPLYLLPCNNLLYDELFLRKLMKFNLNRYKPELDSSGRYQF